MAQIYLRLKALYQKEGGRSPSRSSTSTGATRTRTSRHREELAKELNGSALDDITDPNDPTKVMLAKGKQLAGFAELRDDGKTACGCWIYSGCFTEAGNHMARRDTSDPDGPAAFSKWAWSWPANRRILYNRASADMTGKPWDPTRKLIEWNGTQWTGYDVPDIGPTMKPEVVGPFIMNPEGTGRLFARGMMRDGPFPAHYEPFESPVANADRRRRSAATRSPACSRATWSNSATPRSSPTRRPPTGSPSTSTSGPSTRSSMR